MSDNPEQQTDQNHDIKAHQQVFEQFKKPIDNPESLVELSPRDAEAQAEKTRIEAMSTAISIESISKERIKAKNIPTPSRHGIIDKQQRDDSFARTMKQVQNELSTGSQLFSKIIHNKIIEKTSDIVGGTIARPNAILSGAVVAFVLTLLTYMVAKTIGYPLSGFETIAAFIIGWLIGIFYDYIRVLITGTKS